MIHFIPESPATAQPLSEAASAGPYSDAVARLASIRQALACVEQVAGLAPSERDSEARLAVLWPAATASARRCFEDRSARAAAAAAAGPEALAAQADSGAAPNPAATRRLAEELTRGLDDIDRLFSL